MKEAEVKISIDNLHDYELFELLKREHEKYETGKRARNINHLIQEKDFSEMTPEEVVKNLQNLFF